MVDLKIKTTNWYSLIIALGGKCRICLEGDITLLQIDHIYNDGAEERRKYGQGEKVWGYYLEHLEEALRRLQPLCRYCHDAKTWNNKKSKRPLKTKLQEIEEKKAFMILRPPRLRRQDKFIEILKHLEDEFRNPVKEEILIQRLAIENFTEEEAREMIKNTLKDGYVYEPKLRCYCTV